MLRLYGLHTEAKRCTGRNPGATRILLIARSFACSFLVEADHARDMVQDLAGLDSFDIAPASHGVAPQAPEFLPLLGRARAIQTKRAVRRALSATSNHR